MLKNQSDKQPLNKFAQDDVVVRLGYQPVLTAPEMETLYFQKRLSSRYPGELDNLLINLSYSKDWGT